MKRTSCLLSLVLCASAQAALVSQDSLYGRDSVTLDTDTGLLWLDWSQTVGLSAEAVAAELGNGGLYAGFRFATNVEVGELWDNGGIVDLTAEGPIDIALDFTTDNFAPAAALISLLGATDPRGILTEGLIADAGNNPGTRTVAELQLCTGGPCVNVFGAPPNSALASLGPNDQPADAGSIIIGAALVRDTAVVPLPGALWWSLSALAALGCRCRRQ
ncbi:MAG: hypothetical protein AAGA68_21015 [Pseudomonadota bacterium]